MAVAEAVTIDGIDITTYLVKDAKRAKQFYTETMGLKITMDYGDLGAEFTFPDDSTFGIWQMEDGPWVRGSGVMFKVKDVHAAVHYFKSKGVKIDDHIEESPVCFMAFAEDTEGNSFIIHQRK